MEYFGVGARQAETLAYLEEAAQRVCSFADRTTKVDISDSTLEVDDVVRLWIWSLGRVISTFTSPDNIARSWLGVKLMHVYPKPSERLGLGFSGPEDVNANH